LPAGASALTLNLTECCSIDVESLLEILDTFKRLRREGRCLVLVAGARRLSRVLQITGIARVIPTFPSEAVAAAALRGGGPPVPADPDWEAAHAELVARWREVRRTLDEAPEQALEALNWMVEQCDRPAGSLPGQSDAAESSCPFCPLYYYAWEGQRGDLDCRSVLDDVIDRVRSGDAAGARRQVAELLDGLEALSREDEAGLSAARPPSAEGMGTSGR
jgi:hypothetical protein